MRSGTDGSRRASEFRGGDRALARVSRTPVREALRRLQGARHAERRRRPSLVVAELSRQQVLELYAMREILEGSAGRFAAQHANETEIDLLHRLLGELDKHRDNPRLLISPQPPLSPRHLQAAHNRYLIATLDGMHDALALLHSNTFRLPNRRADPTRSTAASCWPSSAAIPMTPGGGARSRSSGAAHAVRHAGGIGISRLHQTTGFRTSALVAEPCRNGFSPSRRSRQWGHRRWRRSQTIARSCAAGSDCALGRCKALAQSSES